MPLLYRRRRRLAPLRRHRRKRGGEVSPPKRSFPRSLPRMPLPALPRKSAPSTWERIKGFLKQHQVLSRGLSALGGYLPEKYAPYANIASGLASRYGYGRRRHRVIRRQRRVLGRPRKVGRPRLRTLGARRVMRRPVRRVHRRRGRGIFGDIGGFFTRTLPSVVRSGASFVGSQLRKPSTILGGLSMLPGQLSPLFKIGSVVSGLAGHGRRRKSYRRSRVTHRRPRLYARRRIGGRSSFISQIQPMSFL